MSEEAIENRNGDILLNIKVVPNALRFEIKGKNPWRNNIKIAVPAPAEKGKANKELLEKLKNTLNKKAKIKSGKKSTEKKILIKNISTDEAEEKLDL